MHPVPSPKLFISYSHDSPEHQDRVRALADRLRADGIDSQIDQYAPAPPEGWPMWMDKQIRTADFVLLVCTETYLRRVEHREEPGRGRGVLWEADLIYNCLYPEDSHVQKFIPVLFADSQPSWIPLRLRGLTNYRVDTEEGFEDLYRHLTNQPRYQVPVLGERKSLPTIAPQSYPASMAAKPAPRPPTSLDQRHRQQLIKQVRLDWIDGVLEQSLYKVARLELGLASRADAIDQPLTALVHVPDHSPDVVLPGTPISQIFDKQAGALLILGAPGTGKTTLLLELARDLLDRAEQDESHPIPVVFNLSSWAARRQPLTEWLITELNERCYVPKRVARQWVEDEKILPLLDGLDEVAAPHREACVDAINSFRREHGLLHIAVCSRIADYQALGKKLRLRSAVEVQPLTKPQVEDYLDRVGEPLQGLRTALQDDPAFWELLESPLMLWVAMLAYRDVARVATQGESLDLRRHHLFANYVEAMFRRRAGDQLYSPEQSMRWLSYLASTLTRNNQTVFYLENLDFEWLPTRAHQWIARAGLLLISALSSGLIFGLAFGRNSWLTGVLRGGLTVGLILGLSGNLFNIRPVEKAGFRINPSFPIATALRNGLIFGLIGGLIDGLILGLSVGLIFGLIKMFTYEAIAETRATPNQGTRRSVKMAMIAGVISGLIVGLICGLSTGPRAGLGYGLKGGLIGGLLSGGLFATKHVTMRLNLWLSRSAPLRYVAFLDEAKQLLFLRQVGGGYIFVHRLLREYFASLR